jgi:hypothetical protein
MSGEALVLLFVALDIIGVGVAIWLGDRKECAICGKSIGSKPHATGYNWSMNRWEHWHKECNHDD